MSNRVVRCISHAFILSPARYALAAPTPRISSPEIGALSFADLALQTFRRILELGFLRGVLSSLLILCCLVCLLICALYALSACLGHNDTKLWDRMEEVDLQENANESLPPKGEKGQLFHQQTQQNQAPQYHLSRHAAWITKIKTHVSPLHQGRTTPTKPRARSSHPDTPSQPTPTTLRSALSKSPPPLRRLSRIQCLFASPRGGSPTTSPKSVRWADEIQVAVLATVELSFQHSRSGSTDSIPEMDIGLSRTSGELDGVDFWGISHPDIADNASSAVGFPCR